MTAPLSFNKMLVELPGLSKHERHRAPKWRSLQPSKNYGPASKALSLRRRDNTLRYLTLVRQRWTKMINTITTSAAAAICMMVVLSISNSPSLND